MINMPILDYAKHVFLPILKVIICAAWIPIAIYNLTQVNLLTTIIICFTSFIAVGLAIYLVGLNNLEREIAKNIIYNKLLKRWK
jgi:hypothetical protein